jgi:hypothetical protein
MVEGMRFRLVGTDPNDQADEHEKSDRREVMNVLPGGWSGLPGHGIGRYYSGEDSGDGQQPVFPHAEAFDQKQADADGEKNADEPVAHRSLAGGRGQGMLGINFALPRNGQVYVHAARSGVIVGAHRIGLRKVVDKTSAPPEEQGEDDAEDANPHPQMQKGLHHLLLDVA